jgi:tRNA-dihydrouridine synthase 1
MVLSAGASILTVHGRRREQKGHATGTADWSVIRYLRDHLPPDTVLFANGNILQHADLDACLRATGADAVMSAEGNLYDPAIFTPPPLPGYEGREYWRGRDGRGGWRIDAVLRRYLDTVYRYVLEREPPARSPLFVSSDPAPTAESSQPESEDAPPAKRLKHDHSAATPNGKRVNIRSLDPSLRAIQPHCFHLLRSLVSSHHDIRDGLARAKPNSGDSGLNAFEEVLRLVEEAVREGLERYDREPAEFEDVGFDGEGEGKSIGSVDADSSVAAVRRCRRPFWVCQPYVRPLPKEAIERGGLTVGKRGREREWKRVNGGEHNGVDQSVESEVRTVEKEVCTVGEVEELREAVVCG